MKFLDQPPRFLFFTGKGGVGKTTLAAAVAVALAERGMTVHLTTSDPAAHLSETLMGVRDNLVVGRIDPHAETERYRQHVLTTKGAKLDAAGRALLEEDLRRAGIEPWAWVVNNSVAAAQPTSLLLRERARHERGEIDAVASLHSQRYAVVPLLQQEPVGVERLLALSDPLPARIG